MTTRAGDTTYKIGQGFQDADTPFIYTIWDGGGNDTIDARGYSDGVEIDLREGHFSSIGRNGNPDGSRVVWDSSGYDAGNVAIAYGAKIENVIGTEFDDRFIGNQENNHFIGGAGNDEIHGDSGIDTLDYSSDAAYGGAQRVVVNEFVAREGTVIDGFGNTDTFYGIENFTLTGGNDQIYLKVPIGQRTIDGGDGTDSLTYDYGRYDVATGVYNDISGTYTDTLNSVENINMLGGTVVLDVTQDYLFTPQYQYSYAKATQGLDITITNSGHFTASGSGTSATANFSQSVYVEVDTGAATHSGTVTSRSATGSFSDVVQAANSHVLSFNASGASITGSGLGDNVVIDSFFSSNSGFVGSSLSFMSGKGNDDITNYSNVNLVYSYSGGLDTIKGRVSQITFSAGILPDDVNVARNDDGFSITVNGQGTILIDEWLGQNLAFKYQSLGDAVYAALPDAEGQPVEYRPAQAAGGYNIAGTESDDTLIGTELTDDTIYGHEGNDTLIGSGGDDHLYGGAGDDTYVFAAGDGYDTIYDLDGQNILKIEGVPPESIVYVRVGDDLRLEIGSGVIIKDYYTFGSQTIGMMEFDGGVMVDPAIGAATALVAGEDDIFGNNGDNTLIGTDGDDVMYGFGGNDTLDGGYGQNTLYGGLGNDTYRFSNPDSYAVISDDGGFLDTVLMPVTVRDLSFFGWDGEDYLINFSNIEEFLSVRLLNQSEATPDARIENLTFVDGFTLSIQDLESAVFRSDLGGTYNGSSARDVAIGSHSNDILYGNNGDDLLYGGYGHDTIYGGDGSDTLYGSDGHDVLYGGAGFDFILGGDGNDILDGGTGFDWLNGGLGDDTYILRPDGDVDYLQDDGGDNDKIILDTSISFSDLVFAQDGNSLTVSAFGGTMIVLDHFFEGSHTVIEWLDYGGTELFDLRTLYTEPQNTPPQAKNDSFTALEGQTVTGNVLADNGTGADSDADGDPLSVVPAEFVTAAGASVLLLSNGDFIYTPLENYNGSDSFTYTLEDGQGGSQTGTVSFGILAVNDMPEAFDDHFTVNEDEILIGNVLLDNGQGADTDIDGDVLRVEAGSYTTAAGGFVVMDESGTFTYTPAPDYHGTDSFTYMLGDGAGGVSMATATIDVLSVNDGPEARDDRFTGLENNEIEGNLLADNGFGADFDQEGDSLRVVQDMVTSVAGGSVILMHNGDFVYMPPAGYSGEDSFVYTITDGNGGQASATAFITLEPSNEAPVAQDDSASGFILETIGGNVLLDNGFGADADPDGDPLSVEPAGFMTAKGGLVMLQANGDYTYTPVAGFTGHDSFTYTVTDGQGGIATATVNINVGLKGNEIVDGNGGSLLIGSNHTDTILGQGGSDFILGRQAADKILGGSGKDVIHGQNGNDLLIGGSDSDILFGGNGNDVLIGDDILMTGSGDYYHAGSGGDVDLLYGGNGNDLLIGGAGNDCLYGGNGSDTFMFLKGQNGTDRIGDFNARDGDKIDISDVLQGAYDPLADMINQFVKIERQGRDAKLSIDADGADNGSHFTALAIIEGGKDLTLETLLQNGGLMV
ncbi:MAG: Ig-like domain-containing protein [Micavibrio sp.]